MGKSSDSFVNLVTGIVREHFPQLSEQQLNERFSKSANYISITVTVHAQSQEQLDNLYRHLSSTPEILIVL